MKNKFLTYGKKSLSVFLTALMLMTCWVWFAPADVHNHVSAIEADNVAAYNTSLLDGISFNTSVTTIWDLNWVYNGDYQGESYEPAQYKNVLYSSDCYNNAATTGAVALKDSSATTISWQHGQTTFLYDGSTTPQTGVMMLCKPKGSSYNVRTYNSAITNSGWSMGNTYWKGTDGRANFMYVINAGSNCFLADGSSINSSWAWTVNSDKWYANTVKYTGTMSDSTFVTTINPTWKWIGNQKSQGTGSTYTYSATAGDGYKFSVINWKALKAAYTTAANLVATVKANPANYSTRSVASLATICKNLMAAHPNNYVNSSKNDPAGYGSAASAAVSALNSFSLETRKYDVQAENLFSFADWYYSTSNASGNANGFSSNVDAGTLSMGAYSSSAEATTNHSVSSTRTTTNYAIKVEGGKDYTVEWDTSISAAGQIPTAQSSEIFLFFYDENGNAFDTWANFSPDGATGASSHNSDTVTAPANAKYMELRFDYNNNKYLGTMTFSNIKFYRADRATEIARQDWTSGLDLRKVYSYNATVGTLDTPTRKGYKFDGWQVDTDGDGVGDYDVQTTDPIVRSWPLYAKWTIKTLDIGYDNLFSLSDWYYATNGATTNRGGAITADLTAGTLTIENLSTATSQDNNYVPWNYDITVKPNTTYVFEFDVDIQATGMTNTDGKNGVQFHLFENADASVTGSWIKFPSPEYHRVLGKTNGHTLTFTTSETTTNINIRLGTVDGYGVKNTFSNIGLYEKADYDAYVANYEKVREPFKYGDVDSLMIPTRENYDFDGWYTAGGTKIENVSGLYESDTVYAQWTRVWNVNFMDGDGTILETMKVRDGESVPALPQATPSKASDDNYKYDFRGWDGDGQNVTSDLTINPEFTPVAHDNFTYVLEKAATCTENAKVQKYCGNCNYYFGVVTYSDSAEAHPEFIALDHEYVTSSILGSVDSTYHAIKCKRYNTCKSTKNVEHTWTEGDTTGADCVTEGTVHWSCACGATKETTGVTAPSVHNNTEKVNYIAPTCTTEGKDYDTYCNDCDTTVATGAVIKATGHTWANTKTYPTATVATCTVDAVYYQECSVCNISAADDTTSTGTTWTDVGSKLGHAWENTETFLKSAADCENNAVYWQECSRCKISAENDTLGKGSYWTKADTAWGHDYSSTVRNNNDGTHSYLCSKGCDTYGYNKVKEASTACTYGAWDTTGADNHTKTCSACGYVYTQAHNWSAWKTVDGATNTAKSQHTRSCSICAKVEKVDCNYKSVETKETCTTDGYTTHTCKTCSHVYVTAGTKKTGHNFTGAYYYNTTSDKHNQYCVNAGCTERGAVVDGVATVNAFIDCTWSYTNEADGEHLASCVCGNSQTESCTGGAATCTAPAVCEKCNTSYGTTAPHSFTGTVINIESGKHAYRCVYCKDQTIYGVGENQGHTEACTGGTATCSEAKTCEKCLTKYGDVDANNHKWGTPAPDAANPGKHIYTCVYDNDHTKSGDCVCSSPAVLAPDCETAGYQQNYCDDCGYGWQTAPTEALGHKWGAWVDNNDGTHTRTCERAGCVYNTETPGTAKTETASCTKENATNVVTAPTCLDEGYTTYTCKDCGHVWTDDEVPATGHSYTKETKKRADAYKRTDKDCTTALTYWYCCDNCDVSAGTEAELDKYKDTVLYWEAEAATGHTFTDKVEADKYLATAATCTAPATYYYACKACGEKGTTTWTKIGSALVHDWTDTETFLKSASDCVKDEVYYKECSRCHISSQGETDETWTKANTKSGHDFDHDNDGVIGNEGDTGYTAAKDATCLVDGDIEHYTCETCGKHYDSEEATNELTEIVIAHPGHDWQDVAYKAATCTEDGHSKHKACSVCGTKNADYKLNAKTGHSFDVANGYYCDTVYNYHAYYCGNDGCDAYGVDGVEYNADYTEMDLVVVGGIKCTFTGEYVQYDEEDGNHSHKLVCACGNATSAVCEDTAPETIAPTCTADGYIKYVCDTCSYEWTVANGVSATGHSYGEWTSNGNDTHTHTCINGCGASETAACSTEKEASTECGTQNTCDDCGEAFGAQVPHDWTNTEKYLKSAATCTDNAVYYKECSKCNKSSLEAGNGETWTKSGTVLGHDVTDYIYDITGWVDGEDNSLAPDVLDTDSIKEPTCSEEGLSISYCKRCDYYRTQVEKKNPELHKYGEEVSTGGNCATGITYKKTCEYCGAVVTRIDNDVEHEYELKVSKEATCTEAKLEYSICKNCGFDKEERIGEPNGHSWGELVEDKAPTCKNPGRGYKVCKVCQAKSDFEEIAKLVHPWDTNDDGITDNNVGSLEGAYVYIEATEASCSVDGYAGYFKCLDCSYDQHKDNRWLAVEGNYTPATGHADTDGDGECDGKGCTKDLSGDSSDGCGCICHKKSWFSKLIYKILCFFWKLFKIGKSCDCGFVHY